MAKIERGHFGINWSENRLENLRQTAGESMLAYTQRAKTIYNDYLALYGMNQNNLIRQKTAREVARHFIKNVSNKKLKNVLMSHGLNHDLSTITKLALEQEVLQRLDEPDYEITCMYCNKKGHKRRECAMRDRAIRESNSLSNDAKIQCTKCDAIGHSSYICRVIPQVQIDLQRQNSYQPNRVDKMGRGNGRNNQNLGNSNEGGNRNRGQNDQNDRGNRGDRGNYGYSIDRRNSNGGIKSNNQQYEHQYAQQNWIPPFQYAPFPSNSQSMNNLQRAQNFPQQQRLGGQNVSQNQHTSMPNLAQNLGQNPGNSQQRAAPQTGQQGQAAQNRMARTIQVDESYEPTYSSDEEPENYDG